MPRVVLPLEFTGEQRKELRRRRLDEARIGRLEALLPALKSPRPRPRMQDVRDQLDDLAKAARLLQKRYARLNASKTPASEEVRTRLQFAQECLGHSDWSTLALCIDTAVRIATEARDGVSGDTRRGIYRNPIGQILAALGPGAFEVTRRRQPFLGIAQVVSEASGGWGVDDAIRAYLKPETIGVPKGIRTPVTAVKGRCPGPLDDGDFGADPVRGTRHRAASPGRARLLSLRLADNFADPAVEGRLA